MSRRQDRKSQVWLYASLVAAVTPWVVGLWISFVQQSYPTELVTYQTAEVNERIGQLSGVLSLICVAALGIITAALFFVAGRRKLIIIAALLLTLYITHVAWFSYAWLS